MPFRSLKQKKLILAAAHNKEFADKVGFEQEAAKKFVKDSEGQLSKSKRKFKVLEKMRRG